jgi:hypothetical protein
MPLAKIRYEQYLIFRRRYEQGQFHSQRFGQAFINTFYPGSGEETSQIFYEPERSRAVKLIDQLELILPKE